MTQDFAAIRVTEQDGKPAGSLQRLTLDDLAPGEVVIKNHYSGINYKDALAVTGKGRIMRTLPCVAGIDLAGEVVSSADERFKPGDAVLVTGCGIGEDHDGGLAEYSRMQADWVVPMPQGLDARQAMALGTAGFTAAVAVARMQQLGTEPGQGPIAVTGATGGVGSIAINILAQLGYEVVAISGKQQSHEYLRKLGASDVLDRNSIDLSKVKPLARAQWAGAVDNVGGDLLSWLISTAQPWSNIASIGLAGGFKVPTTVMPFILRGVSLIGVTSVQVPMPMRLQMWQNLAGPWMPQKLEQMIHAEIGLDEVPVAAEKLIASTVTGRHLVRLGS